MRVLGAFVAIAILVAVAVLVASYPGHVEIVWQGWQLDTSVGVLVAAAILAALAAALVLRLLSLILGGPRALLRRRRERRRRAGYQALTRGMVAVAAGDPQEARRHARRAEALLAEPPLTLLLSAQAAQIGGDETAAKRFFTVMLDRPETELLGLRGLFNQAMRDGDRNAARHLAERAAALRPDTGWAIESLFDLEAREGRWQSARDTLAKAVKSGRIAAEPARHHRGVIEYELSRLAVAAGERQRGLALAAQAQSLAPDLATPAAHYARLLRQEKGAGRAAKAVERAWRTAPHPELAQVYREIWEAENPLSRVARFERLAAQNPGARETHMALADAALTAQLWGEARRHLEQALRAEPAPSAALPASPSVAKSPLTATGPGESPEGDFAHATPRLCRMMARLEEAESGDSARLREWLDRADRAPPDPRYICASCGSDSLVWASLCPRCGAFDALAWRTPAWAGRLGAPATAESRADADLIAPTPAELPPVDRSC
ncbi:MAG TPA: heme biosynthesis HemY N-terminal domain-containing protein [Stellaceae bacterium]|jgi:HemY protein